ncbi:hypothetical protein GCM10009127_15140 [Alteraurantiacibacter aestuarii]|uniref:Thioredoxin domain-containing protein n=1 Tax=Alteraurantiacibacter aestuarii TaxID=650004 RepID=A0A844ZQL6_9SPHN|nr:thioredoxin domain-containing protein [Alteraurantiacibacter aestuarii]MXO87899.1 thioredoxin domain-containing protein [Alteraurantiacibacter aestuarii]
MTMLRSIALATISAPLFLGLAACSSEDDATGSLTAEPIESIAAPAGSDWNLQAVRTEQAGWLVGNPDAPIKLVEYGSLTCPACAQFSMDGSRKLHEEYVASGRVSYEFRSVMIHGVVDLLLTRALECSPVTAAVPIADQIWGDLNAVTGPFQNNTAALEAANSLPNDQRFLALAEAGGVGEFFAARGISRDQTAACFNDVAAIQTLAETTQTVSEEAGVTGTPTFFLNGQRLDGANWASVEAALQQAGAR